MGVNGQYLFLDAYNISRIIYSKLRTLVTNRSQERASVKSIVFTINSKKEKQSKARLTSNGEDPEK